MPQPARQMKSVNTINSANAVAGLLSRGTLLACAVLLLGGCVTTVGYESPYDEGSPGAAIYQPPPPLPADVQAPCPGDGYLWVPGYWAYSGGYHWVPGSWVLPPRVGVLWTPGYWGVANGVYVWHAGYWGPHVGFYGGVRHGFGYDGDGYRGGRWEGRHFVYNRDVTNVDEHVVHYTYDGRMDRPFDRDHERHEGGRGEMPAYQTRENARDEDEARVHSQRDHGERWNGNADWSARESGAPPAVAAATPPVRFHGPGAERARGAEGVRPQIGPSSGQPRPNFPSYPSVQGHPALPARLNAQAGPHDRPPAVFQGQRPGARPQPTRGVAARSAGRSRPQGQPAPETKGHREP